MVTFQLRAKSGASHCLSHTPVVYEVRDLRVLLHFHLLDMDCVMHYIFHVLAMVSAQLWTISQGHDVLDQTCLLLVQIILPAIY